MRDKLLKALAAAAGATYADVRLERIWRSEVLYRGRNLDNFESSTAVGGVARCLVGGGWGIASFNDLEGLTDSVSLAARIGRVVGERVTEKAALAPVQPAVAEYRTPMARDPRKVTLSEKRKVIAAYNDAVLKFDPRICDSLVRYHDHTSEVTFANSEGAFVVQERPDVVVSVMAMARGDDGSVERGLESHGWAAGFEAAEAREEYALSAARKAVALSRAKPVKGGKYTVIMDPIHAGVFVHEAFGHLCEADFLSKTPRLQEVLKPGRRFGPDFLNIVEDGFMPGERGNCPYDDEGVPRRKVYLIRNGILEGFLHSRETAARMNAAPTGNARAMSYRFQPIIRMRNTYIERGDTPFARMVADIPYGIYACGSYGGETEIETFTFSATHGYEIVNGRVGDLVRNVNLAGNVFETLANVEMVGDDFELHGSGGGCGKGGQFPLPITDGGPHVRVRDVIIGGKA